MKKTIILSFFAVGLLTGCDKLESLKDKIPFLHSEDQTVEEDNNPETQTSNEEKTTNDNISGEQQGETEEEYPWTLDSAFFNDITVVDGRNIIQNPTNTVALVNKDYGLPDGFAPDDLVRPNVTFSFGDQDIEKSYMRKEAAAALEEMFTDAKNSGIILYAVSGYRSYDRQTVIFDAEVNRVGEDQAVQAVAYPGNSEHQTGLAMDISGESVGFLLKQEFEDTDEGKWLRDNAHRFGFILRYPKGKEEITGYKFEPWHFRYVGKESAQDIYENNWTLEEYFQLVRKI